MAGMAENILCLSSANAAPLGRCCLSFFTLKGDLHFQEDEPRIKSGECLGY